VTASPKAVGSWGWRAWLTDVNRYRAVVMIDMPKGLTGMGQKARGQVGMPQAHPPQMVHHRR